MKENYNDSDSEDNNSNNKNNKKLDLKISNDNLDDILGDNDSEEKEEKEEKEGKEGKEEKIIIPKDSHDKKNRIILKIKDLKKLVCPECGELPNLKIEHEKFMIQCNCLNNHSNEYSLIDFIKKSKEKLNEEDKIKCSNCNKKMSALENKENDMYLCNCKKYFCDECKDEHLEK